jgi:hypothetical protein
MDSTKTTTTVDPTTATNTTTSTLPNATTKPTGASTAINTLKAYDQQGNVVYVQPGTYNSGISLTPITTNPTPTKTENIPTDKSQYDINKANGLNADTTATNDNQVKSINGLLSNGYTDINDLATQSGLTSDQVNKIIQDNPELTQTYQTNKVNNQYQPVLDKATQDMISLSDGTYVLTADEQAQVDYMKAQYEQAKQTLLTSNKSTEGTNMLGMARSGGLISANGQLMTAYTDLVNKNTTKVKDLELEATSKISELKQAIKDNNYKMASQLYKTVSDSLAQKTSVINATATATKTLYDRMKQNQKDEEERQAPILNLMSNPDTAVAASKAGITVNDTLAQAAQKMSDFYTKNPAYLPSNTTANNELASKYPDAGIQPYDDEATIQTKLKKSQLYQKDIVDYKTKLADAGQQLDDSGNIVPAPKSGGGSVSFRTNNPGNIKWGAWAESMGATDSGIKATDGGTFAMFPSVEAGTEAMGKLLSGSGYKNLTLDQALKRWSNNGYGANIVAGIGGETMMSEITKYPELLKQVTDAMQKQEGWTESANDANTETGSSSILNATGLSVPAFNFLTQGTSALTRMTADQRLKYMNEAEKYMNRTGTDIATFQSQYSALGKTVEANSLRNNQAGVAEAELDATIQNIRSASTEAKLGNLSKLNIAKIWAGQQLNDSNATTFKFHLSQLREEFALYNAALSGQIDANGNVRQINEADYKRADDIIQSGFATGSIDGFEKALKASRSKMQVVLQNSIDAQNKQVWKLFGVGDKYQSQSPTNSSTTSNTKDLSRFVK